MWALMWSVAVDRIKLAYSVKYFGCVTNQPLARQGRRNFARQLQSPFIVVRNCSPRHAS